MDFPLVLEQHLRAGSLTQINDSTYGITSAKHGTSATVRVLQGRATVEFDSAALPQGLPSSPVLRAQAEKYKGAFYASPQQLDGFLSEMT